MVLLKTWTNTVAGVGPLQSAWSEATTLLNGVLDTGDKLSLPAPTAPLAVGLHHVAKTGAATNGRFTTAGALLGRFVSSPGGGPTPNALRTCVNAQLETWVGNQNAGNGGDVDLTRGGVCKVGMTIGGTRCLADGTPNAAGEYLKPPWQYNTNVPRATNTTGFIRTCVPAAAQLTWSGTSGVAGADDDQIQLYARGGSIRTGFTAVDANGDVWICGGGTSSGEVVKYEKLDGQTGAPIVSYTDANMRGGFNGFIHSNGYIYSTSNFTGHVCRMDPATGTTIYFAFPGAHSICEDRDGNVWCVSSSSGIIIKLDPDLVAFGAPFPLILANFVGMGICARFQDDSIWAVHGDLTPRVRRYDYAGNLVATITPASSANARGANVDELGNVWFAAFSNQNMRRINPATNLVDVSLFLSGSSLAASLPMNGCHYNSVTAPGGMWTGVYDHGSSVNFGLITWTATVPAGCSLTVRYRIANTQLDLASQTWITASNNVPFGRSRGQFIEVQVLMRRPFNSTDTPELLELSVGVPDPPAVVVLTGQAAQTTTAGGRAKVRGAGGPPAVVR